MRQINYPLILISWLLSWFTDNLDGQIARTYNMGSEFGALYDIMVDQISVYSIITICYLKYYRKNWISDKCFKKFEY